MDLEIFLLDAFLIFQFSLGFTQTAEYFPALRRAPLVTSSSMAQAQSRQRCVPNK